MQLMLNFWDVIRFVHNNNTLFIRFFDDVPDWCTLDQRRIDSRLVLLYKVTYDLVAIPATDYDSQLVLLYKVTYDLVAIPATDYDSQLVLLYKVTYDLVAIPATDYLVRNTRPFYKNSFSCILTDLDSERLLQVHIISLHYHPLECPTSPHTCPPYPGTV